MRPRRLRRTTTRVHGQSSQLILYALQILAETNTQCQCLLSSADMQPGVEVNMQCHRLLLPYETAASMCYEGKLMCSVCVLCSRSRACEGGWNKTWATEDNG